MIKLFLSFLIISCSIGVNGQDIFKKDFSKSEATEMWEPSPKIVTPGIGAAAPSDAIVLFDGKSLDNWVMSKDGSPCQWKLESGVMTVKLKTGDIQTKQKFNDCQLHIEFKIPADSKSDTVHQYEAGNSGVYIQERYEVQIFDSYHNEVLIYANGQMASIYKQVIPMVNASSKPGDWNTFDIYYTAPRFNYNGTLKRAAYITLVQNGILTLNHFKIQGTTEHIGIPRYELHDKASILLQGHGSEVSFRNIWIREI